MYLEYFQLREQPFGMTPDPRFLWSSAAHREAFASVVYAIETGRGFAALIAKPGMGKTTLLFQLMERLRSSARTAFLFQSQGNAREFFSNLAGDLGLETSERDLSTIQRQLNDVLIQESRVGRRFVLIIDEAQNLEDSVLESVRMLSNFETPRDKLMQIVLSGQPQLADKLMRPELAQLRQRVSVIARLEPLNAQEIVFYVRHRLAAAGYRGSGIFTPEALAVIADRSEGVPRNINNICFHALSVAFARGQKQIDLSIMEEVLSDLNLGRLRSRRSTTSSRGSNVGSVRSRAASQVQKARLVMDAGSVALREIRHATSSMVPGAASGRLGGKLFWAAAIVTLLIWAAVFWDSSAPRFPLEAIPAGISKFVVRARGIEENVRAGLSQPQVASAPQASSGPVAPAPAASPAASQNLTQTPSDPSRMPSDPGTTSQDIATLSPTQIPGTPSDQEPAAPATPLSSEAPSSPAPANEERPQTRRPQTRSAVSSRANQGSIVVESDVRGGRITVNGRHEPDWVTPHILTLPPGTYRIDVSKGGYSRWSQIVDVGEGTRMWVMANLGLPSGLFVLQTDPPGMEVFIDGRYYGSSMVKTTLAAGAHVYKVVSPSGGSPFYGTVQIEAGRILMKMVRYQEMSGLEKGGEGSGYANPQGLAARRKSS